MHSKAFVKLIFVSVFLLVACQKQRSLKVLCIGDSITQGKIKNDSIYELSYRFWLWEKLDSAGFDVDMIGSKSTWFQQNKSFALDTPVSHYTGRKFDIDHEAYYGIKTEEFFNGNFTHDSITYQSFHNRIQKLDIPDIAFIHLGTNNNTSDSAQTIRYLKLIVEELYARNNSIIIFLAKLSTPWSSFVNHSVEPLVIEYRKLHPELLIVPVDMASGWVNCPEAPNSCTFDWAHPNQRGQKILASKWFKAFMSVGDRKMPEFNPQTTVTNITDSTALISWNAATDNKYLAGYNVYVNYKLANWRYSECGTATKQCIALVPGTSYLLTGLQKGTAYTVAITAVDFANNFASSKEVKFTTP